MAFPKSRILSAKSLSRLIKESTENCEQRFCFILGSGASVESGIPSGNTLEMQWMDCLMGKQGDRGTPAMDKDETRKLASNLYEEKKIEHEFDEIEKSWQHAKEENRPISSEYYFDIYKLRFHANPRKGYSYPEKIMERCDPSLGYHTLAKLLTENNQHNLVITTNFDSLVEDALFLYTDKKPLVVSHESLVDYMDANIQRPIVAKVHRGLMYDPFNSPETTNELKPEWRKALTHALNIYTPIVIGYAGGDHSLMSFLEDDHTDMRKGVYWCYCVRPECSDLPEERIQNFVENKNGYFVAINGFDALMVEIGKAMYGDAIRPGLTAEHLKKRYDKRVQQYNEQWDELNKKPEIQEALQEMNQAEQREEEEREKDQTLTAWDYIRRGNRIYSKGHPLIAKDEYSKAIEIDPEIAAAYNNRGKVYGELGHPPKAIQDYNKAIELDPNFAAAYYNRGNIYRDSRHPEEAIQDYNKAIELDPNFVDAYYNRGNMHRDLRHPEEAIQDYNKAIELDPNFVDAYNNRGVVHKDLGHLEKAIQDYNKMIELDPNLVGAYYNRGIVHKDLRHLEEALHDFNRAIELDPNFAVAYYGRGVVHKDLGHLEKAIQDYNKMIELDPNLVGAYYNRGIAHKDSGNIKEAIQDYNKAIELDPDFAAAYNNRGKVYGELGHPEEAIQDYNKAIELEPNLAVAYYNRGNIHRDLRHLKEAIQDYNKTIELDPNFADPYNSRGDVRRDLGYPEEAIKDYSKAIELNPNFAVAYNNRGRAYKLLFNCSEALKDFTQAIQLDPTYKNAYWNRARSYSAKGEYDIAAADRKKSKEL